MLIYLFLWVETHREVLVSGIKLDALSSEGRAPVIYEKDIVRWGVWLGRHIC